MSFSTTIPFFFPPFPLPLPSLPLSTGGGLIDEDIHFTLSACGRGHYVRVGDRVRVRCVEHRHRHSSWRALTVEPVGPRPHTIPSTPHTPSLPLHTHTHTSPGVPGLMENKRGLVISEGGDVGRVMVGEEKRISLTIR